MKQKRSYILSSLTIIFLLSTPLIYSQDEFPVDDLSSVNFDVIGTDPALGDINDSANNATSRAILPEDIINALADLGGIALLEEQLYLKTNPLNKRPLYDYPFILSQKINYEHCWVIATDFFFNQTSRMNYTSNSTDICSYLAIRQQDLLEKISQSAAQIRALFPRFGIDPLTIIPLFNCTAIQDRRFGFMFNFLKYFESARLRFMIPLYYQERNIFLTIAEREAIETELGAITDDEQKKFQKQHLISDRAGLGDTHFELDFQVADTECARARIGIQATIPTAVPFVKGILGSDYEKCIVRPQFSFEKFFELSTNPELDEFEIKEQTTKIFQDFFLGALDLFNANILDTGLGGEGHFNLGLYGILETPFTALIGRPWAENFTWFNQVWARYIFAGKEHRLFIQCRNYILNQFAQRNFQDASQADSNLAFLNQQFVNFFYPFTFGVKVHPGYCVHWISKFQYECPSWGGISFGPDLWMQTKEKITNLPSNCNTQGINVPIAQAPLAFQAKIFGNLFFQAERPSHTWIFALNGDYTFASSGIGKDFTAAAILEINF